MRVQACPQPAAPGRGSTPSACLRFAIIILSVVVLAGCSSPAVRSHKVWNEWREDPGKYGDTFDWQRHSPVQFLDVLKNFGDFYVVLGIHHDWIRDSDVESLISRLDSQTPCAFVVMSISSQLPQGRSTEGREAAFLLEGYRHRYYPPELSSDRLEFDREELRQWFEILSTRDK